MMNVEKIFSQAVKKFNAKDYVGTLEILDKLKKYVSSREIYMLEVDACDKLDNYVRLIAAAEKCLPMFNLDEPKERHRAALCLKLLANSCGQLGMNDAAIKNFRLAAKYSADKNLALIVLSAAIFVSVYMENFSRKEMRALFDEYKKCLTDKPFPRKFYDHEKIRVGFLSADFYKHPVLDCIWPLFTSLDKNLFERCFYSNVKNPDELTEELRDGADIWRDIVNLADEQAAQLIRDDEIDILFDLSGHTGDNRLRVAAYHPASVQLSGIGYIGSTGLDCFEYFLSDVHCAGDESFFVEKLIKLPHSQSCYESKIKIEPANFPPCIRKNFVTFGSFNQWRKVSDSILRAWKKILDAVPNSHLLLKHKIFGTEDGRNFVSEKLKSLGFDLSRVEMRGFSMNYLAEYADVDIALDTFPYTGGVTTCEAVYMGVPVVSLYGDRFGTRFGLSILNNVGLYELAVDSLDDYVKRAVALANDWELLTILRKNLRTMMKKSPLMNPELYLQEIQAAFRKILDEQKNLWRRDR